MENDGENEVEYEPEVFEINQFQLEITTIAYLPITTLMANREQEKEISGQKLWCGSLCIVNYLFKYPGCIKDCLIIELGAGTGVLSIIASKLGASRVIATDHDERSLTHMKEDFHRNCCDNVEVESLNWYLSEYDTLRSVIEESNRKQQRLILVAGDVVYKSVLLDPFFATVRNLLSFSNCNPELFLCHIPRADVSQAVVQQTMSNKKFQFEISSQYPPIIFNIIETIVCTDLFLALIYCAFYFFS
jgi:16S rRNA G966 N2-methylase RsmD